MQAALPDWHETNSNIYNSMRPIECNARHIGRVSIMPKPRVVKIRMVDTNPFMMKVERARSATGI